MMFHLRNFAASFLAITLTGVVFGQSLETRAETRLMVQGIDGYEVVGDRVLAPESSKPKLVPVGLVVIDCEASIKRLKAEDLARNPIPSEQIDDRRFLILGQGRVWIAVTCVDFDKQIFDQKEFVIEVGEAPPPPGPDEPDAPEPDEPEPTGEFSALTKAIDKFCDDSNLQVDKRQRVAEIYLDIGSRLESKDIKRTSAAVEELVQRLAELQLDGKFKEAIKIAEQDGRTRDALTVAQTAEWYKAVAKGFDS